MHQEKIIQEINTTEQTYVNQLSLLQQYFSTPILEKGLLPTHIHSSIFGQLPAIRRMNEELLAELSEASGNIGLPFLKLAPFLKVYASYANNFKQALGTLEQWTRQSTDLKNFLASSESRPEVKMKLTALLITPIQRIPRYKMLLEELLKYVDEKDESYSDIEDALGRISSVAEHIDRSVDEGLLVQRLLVIQRAITDQKVNVIVPGRKIIKEGILNKVSRKGKGSQKRLFFLFSDSLMYTKLPPQAAIPFLSNIFGKEELDLKANSLECCCILPLRHCKVKTLFGSHNKGITFRLQCADEDMLVLSDTAAEGESWIKAIEEAAQAASQRRQTLRRVSSVRRGVRRPNQSRTHKMSPKDQSPKTPNGIMYHLRSAKERLSSPRLWGSSRKAKRPTPEPASASTTRTQSAKCSPTVASPLTLSPSTPRRAKTQRDSRSPRDSRASRPSPYSCQAVLRRNLQKSMLSRLPPSDPNPS